MASCPVKVNALSQVKDIGCTRSGLVQVPNNQGILSLSRVGGVPITLGFEAAQLGGRNKHSRGNKEKVGCVTMRG